MSEKDMEPTGPAQGDEADLARMGYKQELKYVAFTFFSRIRKEINVCLIGRRELGLLQVSFMLLVLSAMTEYRWFRTLGYHSLSSL